MQRINDSYFRTAGLGQAHGHVTSDKSQTSRDEDLFIVVGREILCHSILTPPFKE